jgi:hypothetical protein
MESRYRKYTDASLAKPLLACMEIMKMFQKILDKLYQELDICDVTFAVVWNVLVADENKSVNQPSIN